MTRDPRMDEPLDVLELPARLETFIRRRELATVGDLIALPPATLLVERNIGRKTIADTARILFLHFGKSWEELNEELAASADGGAADAPQSLDPASGRARLSDAVMWSRLLGSLPATVLDLPLGRLLLPARLMTFAGEKRLRTVREIVKIRYSTLRGHGNIGRKSLADAMRAFVAAASKPSTDPFQEHDRWLPMFRASLASLPSDDRLVVTQRAGFTGPAPTLLEIGELLGVSRERVRQRETHALERVRATATWPLPLLARLERVVGDDHVVPLNDLARRDRFFAIDDDEEAVFEFFVNNVLGGALHVVHVESDFFLSRFARAHLDLRLDRMRTAIEELRYPLPEEELVKRLATAIGWPEGETSAVVAFMASEWVRDGDTITGFGKRRDDLVLACLRGSAGPVTVGDLEAQFGRGRLPDSVVFVERGLVTVPEQVPDWDRWRARLGPACARLMAEQGPERQWTTAELVPLLAAEADLPPWCNAWALGSLLRTTSDVRYLGRNAVALPQVEGDRLPILETVVNLLTAKGGPVPEKELRAELRELRGVAETTWMMLRTRRPFLLLDGNRIGLASRDTPGGPVAAAEAVLAVITHLENEQQGLGAADLREVLRQLGPAFASWGPRLLRSVLRLDGRIRLTQGGGVGLTEWGDSRVPPEASTITDLLAENEGSVPVEVAFESVPAATGDEPDLAHVSTLLAAAGARLAGTEIVADTTDVEKTRSSDRDVSASDDASLRELLEEMPDSAAPVFRKLLEEPTTAVSQLRMRLTEWEAWMKTEGETNMCIERDQVEALAGKASRLLDECEARGASRTGVQWRLAAVKYLVCVDDGESDLVLGGLDDDEAVLTAVENSWSPS